MKSIISLTKKVFIDLYRNFWALLVYNLILAVLNLFLLTPFLAWATSFMASSRGRLSVTNGEVFSFLLSPSGVLFVLIVGSLTVIILYIKHAGMMLIAWQSAAGRHMNTRQAFWAVMRKLPGLIILGSYHVAAHVILMAPFAIIGAIVYHLVFSSMRIYFLFLANAAVRYLGIIAALLLAAIIITIHGAVYLHWVFSLPALLIDNLSASSALTYTHKLLKGTRKRIGIVVFLFWIVTFILPVALGRGFHSIGGMVFARLTVEHRFIIPIIIAIMTAYIVLSFVGEFLSVAINSLTITHLYIGLRNIKDVTKNKQKLFQTVRQPLKNDASGRLSRKQIMTFLVIAVILSMAASATILANFDLHDKVTITAHRGSSFSAPENTLSAIQNAIEHGADYAEIDVRLTADNVVVLLHDRDLFRVAGVKKNLADLAYDQISSLDIGSWFSPEFRSERIPLLEDAVTFSRGRIKLSIELKVSDSPKRLVEEVVDILHKHYAVSECYICSANIKALKYIRELDPGIRIGLIVSQSIGQVTFLDVDFLSVSSMLVKPGLIDAAHAEGKDIYVWTVNKPQQMAKFIDLGVDNIITDVPDVARNLLNERAAMSKQELLFLKVRDWFLR
ncbi:MAG: glycerophosphoryl diester phosphodiesterase membrane domain-containing protein [Sedimentisphaerales bacterium]|nr:glycerophosphoryl diester phosphodiesterase membrane domain-containing protein [Sedimentisphaerales bacterium]